jgi:hypothetical protein
VSDRKKPHNGRDVDGRFRVRQADVDDLLADPRGQDNLRDDVRLGGAVADTGPTASEPARHISELISENRDDVATVVRARLSSRAERGICTSRQPLTRDRRSAYVV